MNIIPNPDSDRRRRGDFQTLSVQARKVVKKDGKWCVESHKTGKSFGCYDTKAQAEARLKQIKSFKDE